MGSKVRILVLAHIDLTVWQSGGTIILGRTVWGMDTLSMFRRKEHQQSNGGHDEQFMFSRAASEVAA